MVIGSHNSWSYLRPRRWWMRLIAFAAKCQRVDIRTQYLRYGVRCFDLRIRFDENGMPIVAHGPVEYNMKTGNLWDDLKWLDQKGDVFIRVLHEVRTKEQYTAESIKLFKSFCLDKTEEYYNTVFWCGRNLYNWEVDYWFDKDPSCEETYGSVVSGKKWLYGWWPWLYAVTHNKAIKAQGTDKDILLIDYVDVG